MIYLEQATYGFEAKEVKNPTLQTVYKSKAKQRSDGHLKIIVKS